MGRETRGADGRFTGSIGSGKNQIPPSSELLAAAPEGSPQSPNMDGSHLDAVYSRFMSRANHDKPLSQPPEPAELVSADEYFSLYRHWAAENGLSDSADSVELSVDIFGGAEGARANQGDGPAFVATSLEGRGGNKFTTRADWDPERNGYVIAREWRGRRGVWQKREIGFTENIRAAFYLVRRDAAYGIQPG